MPKLVYEVLNILCSFYNLSNKYVLRCCYEIRVWIVEACGQKAVEISFEHVFFLDILIDFKFRVERDEANPSSNFQ